MKPTTRFVIGFALYGPPAWCFAPAATRAAVNNHHAFLKPMSDASPRAFPVLNSRTASEEPNALDLGAPQTPNTGARFPRQKNPFLALVSAFQKAAKHHSAKLAAAILAVTIMFAAPNAAMAARTGGRLGGSYSSAPRSSRSMPSRSSSYSRGYSQGYSSGYSSGAYQSRGPRVVFGPTVVAPPIIAPPIVTAPPAVVYGGGGAGVVTYANRGPSFLDLLFLGGVFYAIASSMRRVSDDVSGVWEDATTTDFFSDRSASSVLGPGTTVAQISVALKVPNRDDPNSILSVLDGLAKTAETDSRMGIQNLTSQIALELLRRKSSIVSAWSTSKHFRSSDKAQREFNSVAVRERGKFEAETVSKFGGVDYSTKTTTSANLDKATMAVVTILVNIHGDSTKLPAVATMGNVEESLRRLASDVKIDDCLQSAEILWTPEDRSETLELRDVVADYPELRSI